VVIANVTGATLRPGVRAYAIQFSHTGDQTWPAIASWFRFRITNTITSETEILLGPVPHNVSGALDYAQTIFLEDQRVGDGFVFDIQYLAVSSSGGGSVGILNQGIQIVEWPQV
jgi:hypothetical protein